MLYRVTTKVLKQHSKYFAHLVFHLQKPTAVVVRVFCYHLQIIRVFVSDKEAIHSSELSAFFARLQQATCNSNVSIYYDGYEDFTVMVSACTRENIKRLKT
jgi:bifunctional ADP-heptose synthase (sugar kinase/adenylyltransferase)